MTITSKHLSKIVTHYINTNAKTSHLDQLIESLNTGKSTDFVTVEDFGSLGRGYNVNGHGCYIPYGFGVHFLKTI